MEARMHGRYTGWGVVMFQLDVGCCNCARSGFEGVLNPCETGDGTEMVGSFLVRRTEVWVGVEGFWRGCWDVGRGLCDFGSRVVCGWKYGSVLRFSRYIYLTLIT